MCVILAYKIHAYLNINCIYKFELKVITELNNQQS